MDFTREVAAVEAEAITVLDARLGVDVPGGVRRPATEENAARSPTLNVTSGVVEGAHGEQLDDLRGALRAFPGRRSTRGTLFRAAPLLTDFGTASDASP